MMLWTDCPVVETNPAVMSGVPVMRGTRIPVATVFENIEGGATIEQVVEWFPGLVIDDVKAVLRFVAASAAA
jgi:uncharacterized protein (DUF433 family)